MIGFRGGLVDEYDGFDGLFLILPAAQARSLAEPVERLLNSVLFELNL